MNSGSQNGILGGRWLPRLLTWAGLILMLVGAISAYPALRAHLSQSDPEGLEFAVTFTPRPTWTALPPSPTAPPPLVLPETQNVTAQAQVSPTASPPPAPTASPPVTPESSPSPPPAPTQAPEPDPTLAPTAPPPPPDPSGLVPSRIVIPAINLDAPVIEVGWEVTSVDGQAVSTWVVPNQFAAGWHKTSAPAGQPGNTVLNGHHNVYGEVFRYLVDLEPGAEIVLYAGETPYYYSVTGRHILEESGQPVEVRTQNARWMLPTEDERLTLITCWPYTNNTHRVIVVALPER